MDSGLAETGAGDLPSPSQSASPPPGDSSLMQSPGARFQRHGETSLKDPVILFFAPGTASILRQPLRTAAFGDELT